MTRSRGRLASRIALVTTAVAVVGITIAGVVAADLLYSSAEAQAKTRLSREADVVASMPALASAAPGATRRRLTRLLGGEGIVLAHVTADGRARGAQLAIAALSGHRSTPQRPVTTRETVRGADVLVAIRPLPNGGTVVLVQRHAVATQPGVTLLHRILLALLAGLIVAVVAGVLLARRLARPLRRSADAARRLAAGHRDVRLAADGPAEVAEVAGALNSLGAALQHSESRQREFLLSVSHELRTPLTAVRGFAEALGDGIIPAGEAAATGRTIRIEADRLDRLVRDLLDLARLGAEEFPIDAVPVNLAALVAEAAEVWSARCRSDGVGFELVIGQAAERHPVTVSTDPARLRQIIDGLTENALRITPAGRTVELHLDLAAGAVPTEPPVAVVEVRDGGPGLTEDDLAVAFDRGALYERYRGVRRVGTGLGLAIVAGLAARLGGQAYAASSPGSGARFGVRLPI